MSLNKSKCWHSNDCLQLLKCTVPLRRWNNAVVFISLLPDELPSQLRGRRHGQPREPFGPTLHRRCPPSLSSLHQATSASVGQLGLPACSHQAWTWLHGLAPVVKIKHFTVSIKCSRELSGRLLRLTGAVTIL
jgi:hypothetical protein